MGIVRLNITLPAEVEEILNKETLLHELKEGYINTKNKDWEITVDDGLQ